MSVVVVLIPMLDFFQAENGNQYTKFLGIPKNPPRVRDGKEGHEVQLFRCEPELIHQIKSQAGDFYTPMIALIETESQTKAGESVVYATKLHKLYIDTKGMWEEMIQKAFSCVQKNDVVNATMESMGLDLDTSKASSSRLSSSTKTP